MTLVNLPHLALLSYQEHHLVVAGTFEKSSSREIESILHLNKGQSRFIKEATSIPAVIGLHLDLQASEIVNGLSPV